MSAARDVSITSTGPTTGRLLVGGQDISRFVRALSLVMDAREGASMTLELTPLPMDVQLQEVRVYVDSETADVLTWLGWTPPPEEVTG